MGVVPGGRRRRSHRRAVRCLRYERGRQPAPHLRIHTEGCEDCGSVGIDYVLVYASTDPHEFDSCSQPLQVHRIETQRHITWLDKHLGYPPLSLPSESLKRPGKS